jgi:hypothetical protein
MNSNGRKRGPDREHFGAELEDPNFKAKRVQCLHCSTIVSSTSNNRKTHLANCSKKPRSIGYVTTAAFPVLNVAAFSMPSGGSSLSDSAAVSQHSSNKTRSVAEMLCAKVFPGYSASERLALDRLFSDAIHESCPSFDLFDHPAWQRFFNILSPNWRTPTPTAISTTHLDAYYNEVQMKMARELCSAPAIVIGMDGATNVLRRSISNIIAHDPRPWFIEYLRADLKRNQNKNYHAKSRIAFLGFMPFSGRS